MAFTRKMLKAMGIDEEKVEQIIDAHIEVVSGLKQERDSLKETVSSLEGVEKELATLKGKEDFEEKFKNLQREFNDYKEETQTKELKAKKEEAYRQALLDVNVSEKRIGSILKVSNFDNIELDEKGAIKDVEKVKENLKTEWADFIVKKDKEGADVSNPPEKMDNAFDKLSLAEKMRYANEHPNDANVQAFLKN